MRLIDRIGGNRAGLPDPESVAMMTQSWGATTSERILGTFTAYATAGHSSNAVVFSCTLARLTLIAQAQFKFQNKETLRLHGGPDLSVLEVPWANGTTGDLLARMVQHADIAGNSFVRRTRDTLVIMRPDWTDILSVEVVEGTDDEGNPRIHSEVIGYLYSEGGIGVGTPVFYDVEDVAHWTPIPDPLSKWRGMSWMTPVLREINADVAMTSHRQVFFDSAATPNLILKYQQKLTPDTLAKVKRAWQSKFAGPARAGSTVVLDEGADLTVVGSTFESMRFNELQAAGEARIASASGVPPIVAHLAAGLDAATYSNYEMAFKAFATTTCAHLWQSACAALAKLVIVPEDSRLWYDTTNIPALRQAEKERADAMATFATAASTLIQAGYEWQSVTNALTSGDLTQLKHTGLVSVQLLPPGTAAPAPTTGAK